MIKTIKNDGYNLHIIKTKKFKTISMKFLCWNEIKEEDLAYRNMLADNLLFSCEKYNDNRKLAIVKQDLYNIALFTSNYRNGTQIVTEFSLSCIEDQYTEKGNFKKALNLFFECLNKPNIINNAFSKKEFNITKKRLKAAIKNEKENPGKYAYKRYKELIGNKQIIFESLLGREEDLNNMTPEKLYSYYKTFFTNNHIDIYILGNIDEKFIEKYFESKIRVKTNKTKYTKAETNYKKEYSETEEPSKYNQSRLIMGSSINRLTTHEKKYEALIYNIILGNSPNSKLFQNVREKKSYAYTISSAINRLDGVFIISAGISYKNYEDAKTEVKKQIDEMKNGNFTEKDIKSAKEVILSILKEIDDSPWAIIDHYNNYLYYDADDIETQKKEIKKVTKEDIINVAKKINIDTIYLLKEDTNEKNTNQ